MIYEWKHWRWGGKWTEVQRRYRISLLDLDATISPTGKHCQFYELYELNSPAARACGGKHLLEQYSSLEQAKAAACARIPWEKDPGSRNRWTLGPFAVECRKDKKLQVTEPDWFDDADRTWVMIMRGQEKINIGCGKAAQLAVEKVFVEKGFKAEQLAKEGNGYQR